MKALIALALLASTLTGCAVYTPAGSVVIDPAGGNPRQGWRRWRISGSRNSSRPARIHGSADEQS